MKSITEKKRPQRSAARKAAKAATHQAGAVGKKTTRLHSPSGPVAKAARLASDRRKTVRKPVERKEGLSGLDAISVGVNREILEEVKALRTAVLEAFSRRSPAAGADGDLELEMNSMRRLLSECMERRTDQFLEELAAILDVFSDPERVDSTEGLRLIHDLFDRLGASQFTVENLDFVDPAIHEIVAERKLTNVPDGAVVETLRPGLRGVGGGLIRKARVAVNRRESHEPARD
jgi:molecular chaperone GrpE (heat shock protein)